MKSHFLEETRKRIEDARRLRSEEAELEEWLDGEALDSQVNFRISKADLIKLKSLARVRNMRYQTYLREIIRREIRQERGGGTHPAARVRRTR